MHNNEKKVPFIDLISSMRLFILLLVFIVYLFNWFQPTNVLQAQTSTHPIIFLKQTDIQAINQKVTQGTNPWKPAHDRLISRANTALSQAAKSVVDNGGGLSYGPNYFATDAPYTTDGVFDPNADRYDYSAAIEMSHAVRDLGLAYAFTGSSNYADKALQLIRHWTINSSTKMLPLADNFGPQTPTHDSGGSIEVFITIPGMIYGADLIWNYPGWTLSDRSAFTTWVSQMGTDAMIRRTYSNNFENWRLVLVSTSGSMIDNNVLLDYAYTRYRSIIPNQIDSSGRMVHEINRTNSLSYSLYAINAMIQTAEVARNRGVNLYSYTTGDGRGLKLALDFHDNYAYAADPAATWTAETGYQQITPLTANDNVAIYELANSYWNQTSYMDVINRWGRPMDEIRTLSHVSLTHANRYELSPPSPFPSPSSSPSYTIAQLKSLLQSYLSNLDSNYRPLDMLVNMLDAGWVIRWLQP